MIVAKRLAVAALLLSSGTIGAQAQNYGAIAYSPSTGGNGYSYDYRSRAEAERRAMAECSSRTHGCQVAIWFRDACGAVAVGSSGWGSGWGSNRSRAEQEAINSCYQFTGGCSVAVYACTTR